MDELTFETRQLKQKIMDKYFQLGMEQGISKVSLDQVASELSISKKTIYKVFISKEQIISESIDAVFEKIDSELLPIVTNSSFSVLDKITLLPEIVAKHLVFFTGNQVVELQQSYPQLWAKVLQLRKVRIERYEALFKLAMEQGYIVDVDPKIIVHFFMIAMEEFTKESFITEHNLSYSQSLQTVTKILLEGILIKPME